MINPYVLLLLLLLLFYLFCEFIDDGIRVCVGLAKFQLLRGPQKGIFKQKEQSDPNFC